MALFTAYHLRSDLVSAGSKGRHIPFLLACRVPVDKITRAGDQAGGGDVVSAPRYSEGQQSGSIFFRRRRPKVLSLTAESVMPAESGHPFYSDFRRSETNSAPASK